MKECNACREIKSLENFYKQSSKKDGKHPWCKECCKKHQKENQWKRNERERERWTNDESYRAQRLEVQRNWIDKNREHKRATERKNRKLNPTAYAERRRTYAEKNKKEFLIMARARQNVYLSVKNGDLVRPDNCERCGASCKPEGAHRDYDKPLDVKWLCGPCHAKWDYYDPKIMKKKRS